MTDHAILGLIDILLIVLEYIYKELEERISNVLYILNRQSLLFLLLGFNDVFKSLLELFTIVVR